VPLRAPRACRGGRGAWRLVCGGARTSTRARKVLVLNAQRGSSPPPLLPPPLRQGPAQVPWLWRNLRPRPHPRPPDKPPDAQLDVPPPLSFRAPPRRERAEGTRPDRARWSPTGPSARALPPPPPPPPTSAPGPLPTPPPCRHRPASPPVELPQSTRDTDTPRIGSRAIPLALREEETPRGAAHSSP
jgi:hypothetical protein